MSIKKILVFRNDRFGEFLLNIPTFNALKKSYPEASLTAVVSPSVDELAGRIESIDATMLWEKRRHTLREILAFSNRLRKEKFDLCVVLNPDREFHQIVFLAGIRTRLGYDRKWGFLLTHRIQDRKYLGEKHEVEYNLDLVLALGVHAKDRALTLDISEAMVRGALDKFGLSRQSSLTAVHPWTSDPVKLWPPERFKELILRLQGESCVIIVGGNEEVVKSHQFGFDSLPRTIDLTGKTSLLELAALLKASSVLISSDSGPVHLASCVGTPVIALFRNDIKAKGSKRWGPWQEKAIVIEKQNLSDITVEEVYARAHGLLVSVKKAQR